MGEVYRLKGEYDRAHRILQVTCDSARKQNMRRPLVFALCNHGRTLVNMERCAEALPCLQEAVELAEDPTLRPQILGLISLMHADFVIAYVGLKQYPQAFEAAKMALKVGKESKELRRLGQANGVMGHVLTFFTPETDLPTNPDFYFEKSLEQSREIGLDLDTALTLLRYGESLATRQQYADARTKLQASLAIYERLEVQREVEKLKAVLAKLPN
jgi:tetratricopeptide (TPR) repeat protein